MKERKPSCQGLAWQKGVVRIVHPPKVFGGVPETLRVEEGPGRRDQRGGGRGSMLSRSGTGLPIRITTSHIFKL